ncbi:LytR C-terminal domain-containing protein, partial [Streptomyces sp. SID3343]|uniref:LytR C-terminal domain-containing protein n=1 Tax=Streptomyces sp. SID3343 TaxID=2690260 RepID=UPI0013717F66
LRADRTIDGQAAGGGENPEPAPNASAPAATPAPGAGIDVAVYNGTTTAGLAGRAAETLTANGFTVTTTATATSHEHVATIVRYGSGHKDRALAVARFFPGARLQPDSVSGVTVIVGRAFASQAPGPSSAAPSRTPSAVPSAPAALPSTVVDKVRSADDDPCSNLSYG